MSKDVVSLEGFKELGKQLEKLAGKDAKKVIRKSVANAMNPVKQVAKSKAKMIERSGRLAASIGKMATTNRRGNAFSSRVGVRRDFTYRDTSGNKMVSGRGKQRDRAITRGFTQDNKSAQMYARPIHFGVDSKGRVRRKAGAFPFLDDAIKMQSAGVERKVAQNISTFINQIAK